MISKWMLLGSLSLSAVACGEVGDEPFMESEAIDLGVVESALLLPTGNQSGHSCSGYTSGGGQRVDGALLITAPFRLDVDGVPTDYILLDLSAINYKKNIGWSRKPTAQLAVDLTIDGETATFGTNGEVVSSTRFQEAFPYVSGVTPFIEVTFHGRDGSSCSL